MAIRKGQEGNRHDAKVLWTLGVVVALLFLLWVFFAPGRGFFHYRKLQREIAPLSEENPPRVSKNFENSE